MQKRNAIIITATGLILALILVKYGRFGNLQLVQKQENTAPMAGAQAQIPQTTWPEVEKKAEDHLSDTARLVFTSISGDQNEATYAEKAEFWRSNKHFSLYGHYLAEKSKLEKSEKSITFATPLLIEILRQESDMAVKSLLADDILSLCKIGNDFFTKAGNWEYSEAIALIEGKNETMQGVQKLLAITRENPKDLESNLMLAKMAIQSGQYDKSIDRLEKLLKIYPDNTEAMFFLGEAYKSSGQVEKAKEWFEKCKKIVNNPDFSKEIDDYIKTF